MSRIAALFALLIAAMGNNIANAATFNVTLFNQDAVDNNPGNCLCASAIGGACTLRAAIMEANACPGIDTIHFANSALDQTIALNLAGGAGAGAEAGDLNISEGVNIRGWWSGTLTPPDNADRLPIIDAAALGSRIFRIENTAGAVDIRGLQLRNGNAGAANVGGAIYNNATLNLNTVRFLNNIGGVGGAIANMAGGILTVSNSDFVLNLASNNSQGGGAISNFNSATIRRSSFRDNRHSGSGRATIYTGPGSTLIMEDSIISGAAAGAGDNSNNGIRAVNPLVLQVRNSSLVDLDTGRAGLWLQELDGSGTIRVANSILSNDSGAGVCVLETLAGNPGNVLINHSLVRQGGFADCVPYFGAAVSDGMPPLLAAFAQNTRQLTRYRTALLASSGLRDSGNPNALDPDAAMRCTVLAQNGVQRPQDGDGDGVPRCDLGASEASTTTPTTFIVNSTSDAVDVLPGNGLCATASTTCTLRAAVMEANANPGADRIEFAPGLFGTYLGLNGVGGAETGDLLITEQLTIVGNEVNGRPATTVRGDFGFTNRLFRIVLPPGETVRLENLILASGRAADFQHGGALLLDSNNQVTLDSVTLHHNTAGIGGRGGALAASAGELVLRNADLYQNAAGGQGWAIDLSSAANLVMEDSSVRLHVSEDLVDPKSAIYLNGGHAWLRNVTLSGNENAIRALGNFDLELRNSSFHSDYAYVNSNATARHLQINGAAAARLQVIASAFDNELGATCEVTMAAGSTSDTDHYNLSDGTCATALGLGSNIVQAASFRRRTAPVEGRVGRVAMPKPGSGLIDRVPADTFNCPSQDQRGASRPVNATGQVQALCDVGAVEASQIEAQPQPWIVNVYDIDLADASACDGRCDADETQPGLQCTLRAAAMESGQCGSQNYPAEILIPQAGVTLPLTIPYIPGQNGATGALLLNSGNYERRIIGPDVAGDQRPLILASNSAGIIDVIGPASLTLANLRMAGGRNPGGVGGAISSDGVNNLLRLSNVELFDNQAGLGGAIYAGNAVLLERVAIHGNSATSNGSGIRKQGDGDFTLIDSSITANTVLAAGQRAAISINVPKNIVIQNSTISGNNGTGVELNTANVVDRDYLFESSTIANNQGFGIALTPPFPIPSTGTLSLSHMVLSGNVSGGCSSVGGEWGGSYDTIGYNVSQDNGCQMAGGSNLIGVPALLGPLQTPAIATAFHAPLPGSPLIDAGAPDASMCPDTDQLGNPRPQDGDGNGVARCNIGAIENGTVPPVIGDVIFANGFDG